MLKTTETLHSCLRARTAPTTLQWVRGHSGVVGNEIADGLCERAHREGLPPTPPVVTDSTRHCLMLRGHDTTGHPRWVLKKQAQCLHNSKLRQNSQLRRACPPNGSIELAITLLRPDKVRSFKDSTRYAFRSKLITATLPTMERQGTWHPAIYPNTLCRRCHACAETVDHLLACPAAVAARQAMPAALTPLLADKLDDPVSAALAVSAVAPLLDHHSLKGFGDLRWGPVLHGAGLDNLNIITRLLVECLAMLTFDHIWLPRCDATILWERARHIHRRDKTGMPSSGGTQPSHLTPLPPAPPLDYISILPAVTLA